MVKYPSGSLLVNPLVFDRHFGFNFLHLHSKDQFSLILNAHENLKFLEDNSFFES